MNEIATSAHNAFDLADVLVFLCAAVAVVPIFKKLRISPILGYLIVGAFLGPAGFGLIDQVDGSHIIAEYGIVFLLFTIGLELSFERLANMRLFVFGLGGAQFFITAFALGGVSIALGQSLGTSIVIGTTLALSSTAFVIKLMSEKSEMATPLGRASFSVLLFQDLAVILLIAIAPLMHQMDEGLLQEIGLTLLKAATALVVIILIGRLIVRPIYRIVASTKSPETFVAMTLLLVLGIGWLTHNIGLPMTLGAFLAGLLISETEYCHQVEVDIQPFKGILLGLFFMSVGMKFDVSMAIQDFQSVLLLVIGLMTIKTVILVALAYLFKFELGPAIRMGILLSQGGEFAFVMLNEAHQVVPDPVAQALYITVTISMALTPVLVSAIWPLCAKFEKKTNTRLDWLEEETEEFKDHVIISGFGRVGETVVKILTEQGIPFVVLDIDAGRVAIGRSKAVPIYYGDACFGEVLKAVGARRARAIVITIGDHRLATRAATNIRYDFPDLPLYVRARDTQHVQELQKIGVTATIPETLEASLQLGASILRTFEYDAEEIDKVISECRRSNALPIEQAAS